MNQMQMPGYLTHVTHAEDIGAHLLLNRQVPLHDVRLRVVRVMSVDLPRLRAVVWFPNDEQPIEVKLLSSVIPGDWQHKSGN